MQQKRGYSMPLMPNKKDMWGAFVLTLLAIFWVVFLSCTTITEEQDATSLLLWAFGVCWGIMAAGMFLISGFAKLHLVPEGVAVTLFGITLKRVPVGKIRLITASRAVYRGRIIDKIALCNYSLEELTAHAYQSKPKLFRNNREFRTGEWADEYLSRRLIRGLIPDRRIFWLWWDAERLELLQQMYPQAQWLDMTKDKIFDKQLNS